jgi:hypothetical protein
MEIFLLRQFLFTDATFNLWSRNFTKDDFLIVIFTSSRSNVLLDQGRFFIGPVTPVMASPAIGVQRFFVEFSCFNLFLDSESSRQEILYQLIPAVWWWYIPLLRIRAQYTVEREINLSPVTGSEDDMYYNVNVYHWEMFQRIWTTVQWSTKQDTLRQKFSEWSVGD